MNRPTRLFRVEFVAEAEPGFDFEHRNFWGKPADVADFIATLPEKRREQTTILGVWRGDVRWTPVTPAELESVSA